MSSAFGRKRSKVFFQLAGGATLTAAPLTSPLPPPIFMAGVSDDVDVKRSPTFSGESEGGARASNTANFVCWPLAIDALHRRRIRDPQLNR